MKNPLEDVMISPADSAIQQPLVEKPEGPASATVRFHHGTDMQSAMDIRTNGLDAAKAAAYNGSGEFWATSTHADAAVFAQVNPSGGRPACFEFELAGGTLHHIMTHSPPLAFLLGDDIYEFLPGSFSVLNLHMANRQVVPVP